MGQSTSDLGKNESLILSTQSGTRPDGEGSFEG